MLRADAASRVLLAKLRNWEYRQNGDDPGCQMVVIGILAIWQFGSPGDERTRTVALIRQINLINEDPQRNAL